jgi:hypothetical protein
MCTPQLTRMHREVSQLDNDRRPERGARLAELLRERCASATRLTRLQRLAVAVPSSTASTRAR